MENFHDRLDLIEACIDHSSQLGVFDDASHVGEQLKNTVGYLRDNYDGKTSSLVRSCIRREFEPYGGAEAYFDAFEENKKDFTLPLNVILGELGSLTDPDITDNQVEEAFDFIVPSVLAALHCAAFDLPLPA